MLKRWIKVDIPRLQLQVNTTTKKLGYTITRETTIAKLKDEINELDFSKPIDSCALPKMLVDVKNDGLFFKVYKDHVKGTELEEIPDMFFVLLSYCEEIGLDFETLAIAKKRFNDLLAAEK